jgi:hypothetical protein
MRISRHCLKASLMLFLVAIAPGCNRGSESIESSQVPTVTAPVSAPVSASTSSPGERDAALSVTISPALPTTRDMIQAVSIGNFPVESYRWEINSQSIEGQVSSSLPAGIARKGDAVAVIATARGREVRATVQIVNSPPKVVELPFTPADFYQGIDITVTPRVVDPDDDPVSFDFKWFVNDDVILGEKEETLSGHRFRRGDRIALQVIPFDGTDYGEPFQSGAVAVPNASPDIVSTPPVNFKSRVYQYHVKAEDVDNDSLTYVLETAPDGMVINNGTGEIVWPIGAEQSGVHKVKIVVLDETQAKAFQEYTITISLTE